MARADELLIQVARDLRRLMELVNDEITPELKRLAEKVESPMPPILPYRLAAQKMSIGSTKLKSMVRTGEISNCLVGQRKMIPSSEIYRLSQPIRVKARTSGGRPKVNAYDARAEAQKGRERLKRKRKARRKLRS